jgi:hypothetical protein
MLEEEYEDNGLETKKPRDGIDSPPTGLSRFLRSQYLRASQHASGHQRSCCTKSAPSGNLDIPTPLMARCYARWRIHCKPPSWLRPRREMAHPPPSLINVEHCKTGVKSSVNFLPGPERPSARVFPVCSLREHHHVCNPILRLDDAHFPPASWDDEARHTPIVCRAVSNLRCTPWNSCPECRSAVYLSPPHILPRALMVAHLSRLRTILPWYSLNMSPALAVDGHRYVVIVRSRPGVFRWPFPGH